MAKKGYTRTAGYYGRYNNPQRSLALEKKFHDKSFFLDPSGGTTYALNAAFLDIAQGTTESTRIGRRIRIWSVHVQGRFYHPGVTTQANASNVFKLVMLLDKQCNGAAPIATDLYESDEIYSFRNLANSRRFKTLHEQVLPATAFAGSGSTFATGDVHIPFRIDKRFKSGLEVEYDSTTGAITEIKSNNLVLGFVTEDGITNTTALCKVRVRFTDI